VMKIEAKEEWSFLTFWADETTAASGKRGLAWIIPPVRSQKLLRYSSQQLAIRGRRRAVEVLWDVTTVDGKGATEDGVRR